MRPPDEKTDTQVSRKSGKRHISARDFRLPKPYRLPVSSQARQAMPRLRAAAIACSALLVAGLIAALALITHENVTAPHPLAVADDKPAPRLPAAARAAPPPAAGRNHAAPAASAPPAVPDDPSAAIAPAPAVTLPLTMEELPDDPDVDLIATILLLTPGRADTVPPCANPPAGGCGANAAPDP